MYDQDIVKSARRWPKKKFDNPQELKFRDSACSGFFSRALDVSPHFYSEIGQNIAPALYSHLSVACLSVVVVGCHTSIMIWRGAPLFRQRVARRL